MVDLDIVFETIVQQKKMNPYFIKKTNKFPINN